MHCVGKYLQRHGASSASEAQVEERRKEENERGKQHWLQVFQTGTAMEPEPTKFPGCWAAGLVKAEIKEPCLLLSTRVLDWEQRGLTIEIEWQPQSSPFSDISSASLSQIGQLSRYFWSSVCCQYGDNKKFTILCWDKSPTVGRAPGNGGHFPVNCLPFSLWSWLSSLFMTTPSQQIGVRLKINSIKLNMIGFQHKTTTLDKLYRGGEQRGRTLLMF